MPCAECDRLKVERDRRARAFALSVALVNAMLTTGDNIDRNVNLRAKSQEAKVDLELAEAALAKHQTTHLAARLKAAEG